jgi:hypothetical protein
LAARARDCRDGAAPAGRRGRGHDRDALVPGLASRLRQPPAERVAQRDGAHRQHHRIALPRRDAARRPHRAGRPPAGRGTFDRGALRSDRSRDRPLARAADHDPSTRGGIAAGCPRLERDRTRAAVAAPVGDAHGRVARVDRDRRGRCRRDAAVGAAPAPGRRQRVAQRLDGSEYERGDRPRVVHRYPRGHAGRRCSGNRDDRGGDAALQRCPRGDSGRRRRRHRPADARTVAGSSGARRPDPVSAGHPRRLRAGAVRRGAAQRRSPRRRHPGRPVDAMVPVVAGRRDDRPDRPGSEPGAGVRAGADQRRSPRSRPVVGAAFSQRHADGPCRRGRARRLPGTVGVPARRTHRGFQRPVVRLCRQRHPGRCDAGRR